MEPSIGIKLADGTFFPILNEDASVEKALELTTVRDHQESVQINLFKKTDAEEPEYIGSLIVEEIADGLSGDPTINLRIKLDAEKNLSAEAEDEGSGSRQSLKVSLKTLNEDTFDAPDFSLANMEDTMGVGNDPNRDDVLVPEVENDYEGERFIRMEKEQKKKPGMWLIVLLVLLCIGALVAAILLLTKKTPSKQEGGQTVKEDRMKAGDAEKRMDEVTENPPVQDPLEIEMKEKAEAEKAEKEALEKEMMEKERLRKEASAKRKTAPVTKTGSAVRYKIKWGDTLWDLSETFYKNPWQYKKIARHNKIKNPSLIISGTYIDIPPK